MSMTDARDYLGVSQATLHRLVYGDAIRAFKRGREIRIRTVDADAYLEAQVIEPGTLGHLYDRPRAQVHR